MATALSSDVLQDDLAVSLARALAAANRRAQEAGVDATQSVISVQQLLASGTQVWRVNYGRQNAVGRRGGDLIVDVDPVDASVKQVLRGQ